jgi:urease accessory protein
MGWPGHLALNYRLDGGPTGPRTVLHDRHLGPLRVLQSLYPESPGICHNVLVHPPGGIVGGDALVIEADMQHGAHTLITTPGATRFYRSAGDAAHQRISFKLHAQARLEWLPLETLVHSGAKAHNQMRFELEPGAEMFGWDVLALGLPASNEPFLQGHFHQEIELPGVWLERARISAADTVLLNSPLGWDGERVLATLWFAAGQAQPRERLESLLELARSAATSCAMSARIGITAPSDRTVVLRLLAPHTEAAMAALTSVWAAWRLHAWQLPACAPRVWRM